MTERDADQVRRARAGDRAAYGALVDAYQGMVFATALNITGNYSDAEDVVQDAFLRAFERLGTLAEPMKFPAWLRTLASRSALQLLRKKRHVAAFDLDESAGEQTASGAESPAEAYARAEFARLLWQEVGELPPKTREAVLLFYMEGYSVSRAAAYLDCSEGALKTRLHFGREKLRQALLEKVEAELRDHRPTEKTRNAVLAALPPDERKEFLDSLGVSEAAFGRVIRAAFSLRSASACTWRNAKLPAAPRMRCACWASAVQSPCAKAFCIWAGVAWWSPKKRCTALRRRAHASNSTKSGTSSTTPRRMFAATGPRGARPNAPSTATIGSFGVKPKTRP